MALDLIYQAGDDALQNQFQVIIPAFPNVINIGYTNIRVLSISIPELAMGTYEIPFGTDRFTKPSGKNETTKEFSISFRIDKYWQVYNGMRQWHGLIFNQDTGAVSSDAGNDGLGGLSPLRVPITVQTIDSNNTLTGGEWIFEGCWPSTVGGFDFSQDVGDPITIDTTFQYVKLL
jgi:hypothetical protein